MRKAVENAKKTAAEMLALHGEAVGKILTDKEAIAWKKGAYTEYVYWKLVREYARDASKSAANRRNSEKK